MAQHAAHHIQQPTPAITCRSPPTRQPIEVKGRTFQQPSTEPLGDDWAAELRLLQGTRQASAAAIQRSVRSDPTGLRAKVAECGRMLASLPEEEAEEARAELEGLHNKLALLAEGVALRPTRKRSGKQHNKQRKRSDEAKLTHALFPSRSKQHGKGKQLGKRKRLPTAEVSDPLPNLRQKDESSKKVGGRLQGCRCGAGDAAWGWLLSGVTRSSPHSNDVCWPALAVPRRDEARQRAGHGAAQRCKAPPPAIAAQGPQGQGVSGGGGGGGANQPPHRGQCGLPHINSAYCQHRAAPWTP